MNNRLLMLVTGGFLVLALVLTPLLTGCSQPAPAPSPAPVPPAAAAPKPAPTQASAPAPQPAAAQWNLKMHHHTTGITHEQAHVPYAKMIEDATKGRVKITIYPAEALGKMAEAYTLATSGIADISWGMSSAFPGQFPMTDMLSMPLMGIPNGQVGSRIMWSLYQKFGGAFDKEFAEVKVLALHAGSPSLICTSKKPVRTMDDIKGLRLRTPPGPPTEMIKTLGANPMMISPADTYLAMEKGTVDGHLFDWIAIETFKYYEVTKYYSIIPFHMPTFWIIMNKKVWNSMPADVQQQVMSVSGEAAAKHFGGVWDRLSEKGKEMVKTKPGQEIIDVPPAEIAKWVAAAKPVHEAYVSKLNEKGLPGKDALAEILKLAQEFK